MKLIVYDIFINISNTLSSSVTLLFSIMDKLLATHLHSRGTCSVCNGLVCVRCKKNAPVSIGNVPGYFCADCVCTQCKIRPKAQDIYDECIDKNFCYACITKCAMSGCIYKACQYGKYCINCKCSYVACTNARTFGLKYCEECSPKCKGIIGKRYEAYSCPNEHVTGSKYCIRCKCKTCYKKIYKDGYEYCEGCYRNHD